MPTRKLVCTDNKVLGTAPTDVRIVRWVLATDEEGLTLNAGLDGLVLVWRIDPATDDPAWTPGYFLYVTDSLTP